MVEESDVLAVIVERNTAVDDVVRVVCPQNANLDLLVLVVKAKEAVAVKLVLKGSSCSRKKGALRKTLKARDSCT